MDEHDSYKYCWCDYSLGSYAVSYSFLLFLLIALGWLFLITYLEIYYLELEARAKQLQIKQEIFKLLEEEDFFSENLRLDSLVHFIQQHRRFPIPFPYQVLFFELVMLLPLIRLNNQLGVCFLIVVVIILLGGTLWYYYVAVEKKGFYQYLSRIGENNPTPHDVADGTTPRG